MIKSIEGYKPRLNKIPLRLTLNSIKKLYANPLSRRIRSIAVDSFKFAVLTYAFGLPFSIAFIYLSKRVSLKKGGVIV